MLPVVPKDLLSRACGRVARVRLPSRVQGRLNRFFARLVGANLAESERPPEAYASVSDFFGRGLAPGLRTWPADPGDPGSPSDGIVGTHGRIEAGTALQAKGIPYRVGELLGSDADAERFFGGVFLTIYLAPRHYHRVHAPCAGALRLARRIPGRLFPVNEPAVTSVGDLFVRNERLVGLLEGEKIEVAVVAVGALNVGSISADFDPDSGRSGDRRRRGPLGRRSRDPVTKVYDPPLPLNAADPLMTFHLGSTVVVLVKGRSGASVELNPSLRPGREIRLGEPVLVSETPRS